jgi:LmbE family N-acetylglucosaminyl deacetylase
MKDISHIGSILGIWAHPDDEAFSSAGLMMRAVAQGQRVVVVTATKGDAGESADESRWPKKSLAEVRTKELEQSLACIGVAEHHWLGYQDGALSEVSVQEAVAAIQQAIGSFVPDTIVTFEEQGITGHEDHQAVHMWAIELAKSFPRRPRILCAIECAEFYETYGRELHAEHNIYFNVESPKVVSADEADFCVCLDIEEQKIKMKALAAHASQTNNMLATEKGNNALQALSTCECFIV